MIVHAIYNKTYPILHGILIQVLMTHLDRSCPHVTAPKFALLTI